MGRFMTTGCVYVCILPTYGTCTAYSMLPKTFCVLVQPLHLTYNLYRVYTETHKRDIFEHGVMLLEMTK